MREMTMTVDEWVSARVLPEHRETVAMVRDLVRECAPHAEEVVSYDMPVFKARQHIFAWIIQSKKHITFSFRAGTSLEDKFDRLRGSGKHARHLKLSRADSVDKDVLRYYIKQALELDAIESVQEVRNMDEEDDELQTEVENELAGRILQRGKRPKVRKVKAGVVLVHEGEQGKALFVLLDGRLSVKVEDKVLAELGPGSVVGERAVVDAGLQKSTVPVTVLVLQGPGFAVGERHELKAGSRTSTLTAVTDCRVVAVAPEDVDPEILRQLAEHHHREGDH
jgi:uncharacterized protein YdhG (YjbR/CyaY superfamily)